MVSYITPSLPPEINSIGQFFFARDLKSSNFRMSRGATIAILEATEVLPEDFPPVSNRVGLRNSASARLTSHGHGVTASSTGHSTY